MIFSKEDGIYLFDDYNVSLSDSVLLKLEDGMKKNKEMLLTIKASSYGLKNGNGTVYRHDTVAKNIQSFVQPKPKPIIEKHRPKDSEVFGRVIAADYKLTDHYNDLKDIFDLEKLSTDEYIELFSDYLLDYQRNTPGYSGLAYVEVTGKLTNKTGIKKVLDGEFLSVSIGAAPKRLICSECGQDQVKKMCTHYPLKRTPHIFMLAESLEYQELSFVNKPADINSRILRIHDGVEEVIEMEGNDLQLLDSSVDVIDIKDFFKIAEGKKIVCVDNICTIINQEEGKMAGKKKEEVAKEVRSLCDEFSAEKLSEVKLADGETVDSLKITDEEIASMTDKQFAIIQKSGESIVKRFPVRNALDVKMGLTLIDSAENLTESEREKAQLVLNRAAKKFGVTLEDKEVTGENTENLEDNKTDTDIRDIDTLIQELKDMTEAIETKEEILEDGVSKAVTLADPEKNPLNKIFDLLKWFSNDMKWAGESLNNGIKSYLEDLGKAVIAKDEVEQKDAKLTDLEKELETLKEEVECKDEEIEMLDKQNVNLNYQLRTHLVDEILASKEALGLIEDSVEVEKEKLLKRNYETLTEQVSEYRKLTIKLKDSTVNNNSKIDIKKISDPTHADSLDGNSDDTGADSLTDAANEKKELTMEEKVNAFKTLFGITR